MDTYTADTCTVCQAPVGYQGRPRTVVVCRTCRAWECEYECPHCPPHRSIHAHVDPCEHGVQPHHCILPDPNSPWPPPD